MSGPGKKGAKGYGTSLPGGLRWEMDQVIAAGGQPAPESQPRKPQQLSRKDKRAQAKVDKKKQRQEVHAKRVKVCFPTAFSATQGLLHR